MDRKMLGSGVGFLNLKVHPQQHFLQLSNSKSFSSSISPWCLSIQTWSYGAIPSQTTAAWIITVKEDFLCLRNTLTKITSSAIRSAKPGSKAAHHSVRAASWSQHHPHKTQLGFVSNVPSLADVSKDCSEVCCFGGGGWRQSSPH